MVLQHLPVGNDLVPSKQTLDFSVSSFGWQAEENWCISL
jgi:hypothetical protein